MVSHDFTPENHRLLISKHLLGSVISQLLQQHRFALVLVEILIKMICALRELRSQKIFLDVTWPVWFGNALVHIFKESLREAGSPQKSEVFSVLALF